MKKNILYLGFFSMLMVVAVNAVDTTKSAEEAVNETQAMADIAKKETLKVNMFADAVEKVKDPAAKAALEKQGGEALVGAAIAVQEANDLAKHAANVGNATDAQKAQEFAKRAQGHFNAMQANLNFGGFLKKVIKTTGPIIKKVAPIVLKVGKGAIEGGLGAALSGGQQQQQPQQ